MRSESLTFGTRRKTKASGWAEGASASCFDIEEIILDDTGPTFNLIKDAFKLPESYIY